MSIESDFWRDYRRELSEPSVNLLEAMHEPMEIMGVSRTLIVAGLGISGLGLGVSKYLERRSKGSVIDKALLFGSRSGVIGGGIIGSIGLVGELFGRKALSVIKEVSQDRTIDRSDKTLYERAKQVLNNQ